MERPGFLDRLAVRMRASRCYRHLGRRDHEVQVVLDAGHFVARVLPFSMLERPSRGVADLVEPELVLGGNYVWPSNLPEGLEGETLTRLSDQEQTNPVDLALYEQIGSMPLYVPWEGKNRVPLFRKHRRKIPAEVVRSGYPEPPQLRLVRLAPFGVPGLQWLGVGAGVFDEANDDEGMYQLSREGVIAVLAFPESVEFLKSYGVQQGGSYWRVDAPLVARRIRYTVTRTIYRA